MGFFSSIKDAAFTANEDAHGVRLLSEFRDSIGKIGSMPRKNSDEIIQRYIFKRAKIKPAMENWTIDGIFRMAKTLKDEARQVTDFNIIEGYALWMTSAWLESGVRKSEKAVEVFNQLDGLARAHQSIIDDTPAPHQYSIRPNEEEYDVVLFDAVKKILTCVMIGRINNPDVVKMEELTPQEQMTLAAGIGGVASVVAKEFGEDLIETLALAAGMLELYGMSKRMSTNGMSTGLKEYNPNPIMHYGITTWRGIEAMRKFRQGIDDELNCLYVTKWLFDGKY